jgi:hypothetical protein
MENRIRRLLSSFVFWLQNPRQAVRASVVVWVIPMLVIAATLILQPGKHRVTRLYDEAAVNWSLRHEMYRGPKGMNYLPQFVLFFSPFHALPPPVGDIAWRFFAAALLATGIWRLVRNHFKTAAPQSFFWISLLCLPLSLSTLRNGLSTTFLTAFSLHAVASMAEEEWWAAVCLMFLALAMKPLGIVLILLAPVVYAPLRWRSVIALLCFAAVPFLFADWSYVATEYREAFVNLQECAGPTSRRFADINGVLRPLGFAIPFSFLPMVCALFGLVTLALWWVGARLLQGSLKAAWLYTLTAVYLMLFTPMNEANSYVLLVPALGFLAIEFFFRNPSTSRWGLVIMSIIITMSFLPNMVRPVFGNLFAQFWYPLMTIIFLGLVIACYFQNRIAYSVGTAASA